MRIAIYKDTLANRRGADVAVRGLAEGLCGRGHDAVLFEKGDLARRLSEKWDVFVSSGTNELLDLAAAFPRRFPWPVVQQFHTDPRSQFKRKRIFRNWRIRKALRKVAAIQVLRAEFASQVSGYGPRVETIGNWSSFEGCAVPSSCAGSRTVLYPAAFSRGKNHRLLIEAFASLSGEFPDWTLELYGSGSPGAALPRNVRHMGYADLGEVYPRCSFLAFPSLDEGFGLVIADAAAFGRPAVMLKDWIGTAAAGGGIVTRPTAEAYAGGLRTLMADASLRVEMGEAARRFCAGAYSRDAILDRWERLLSGASAACSQTRPAAEDEGDA